MLLKKASGKNLGSMMNNEQSKKHIIVIIFKKDKMVPRSIQFFKKKNKFKKLPSLLASNLNENS